MTKIISQIYNYHYSYDLLKNNTNSNYEFIDAKLNSLPEFTYDYFNKLLKNKSSRKKLSSLYLFCNITKRRFIYDSTELRISQCNDKYLRNYFTHQKLSDIIKEAIKFNILIVKSQSNLNKCKAYIGVRKNMQKLIDECKGNNINLPTYDIDEQTNMDSLLNTDLIKFSSKLNIKTNPKILNAYKESIVKNVLYRKYPELREYQNLANEINFKYYKDTPELAIKFEPTIHFSSKSIISKIGIRYTCEFANYPKNELNDEGIRYPINRKKYINDNGFKFEHDVKSSIPRVAYLLKTGTWLDESVDLYEMIWKEFKILAGDNDDSVWNECTRDFFKTLFMEVYFNSSANQCRSNLIKKFRDNTGKDVPESDIKDIQLCYNLLYKVIDKLFYRCDSEIFYWESLLYMKVLKCLLDYGFQVATCYDCFYAKKEGCPNKYFESRIKEYLFICARNLYNVQFKKDKKYIKEIANCPSFDYSFFEKLNNFDNEIGVDKRRTHNYLSEIRRVVEIYKPKIIEEVTNLRLFTWSCFSPEHMKKIIQLMVQLNILVENKRYVGGSYIYETLFIKRNVETFLDLCDKNGILNSKELNKRNKSIENLKNDKFVLKHNLRWKKV